MTSRAFQAILIANFKIPAEELAAYLAANDHWDAFAHFWQELLPGSVYKVLQAVMQHRYFDAKTWQAGEAPFPSHERLAALAHLSERTVSRILARDADKRYTYTYRDEVYHRVTETSIAAYDAERARLADEQPEATPWPPCAWGVGNLVAIKRATAEALRLETWYELGDLIALFIRGVERRRYFDERQQRSLRTTNAYDTVAFLPLPPTLECDLAYAQQLQKVQARRTEMLTGAAETRAASGAPTAFNPPKYLVECAAKMTEEDPVVSQPEYSEEVTSIYPRRESDGLLADASAADGAVAALAISKGSAKPGNGDEDEAGERDRAIGSDRRPQLLAAHRAPPASPGVDPSAAAQRARQARADRRAQIDAVIGSDVQRAAALREDNAPLGTRRWLVDALTDAQTPLDQLVAALHLIEHRFDRVYGAGGKPIAKSAIATWIMVAKSVIAKGRGWGYDFGAQDAREARAATLRRDARAAAAQGQMGYIQTPGYYARVGAEEAAAPTPPPVAPVVLPDAAAEARWTFRPRAGVSRAAPRRAPGRDDDDDERSRINSYRR
ncbi:MAG: hypothetical protein H0X24_01605 [Ktedonobacterales bacterium]|nr:hypothetical protein [Ktedonobacterales bacterium]